MNTMLQSKGVFYPNGQKKKSRQRAGPVMTKKVTPRQIQVSQKAAQGLPPELQIYLKKMNTEERLKSLVHQSNDVLFKCKTVFPFDFFPDTLIVDKTKVNIINKIFFFSEAVHSIPIKNIKDVEVETNVFFATMNIIPDVYLGQTTCINYLPKSDALEARRIIQGLVLCKRENIDITSLDANEIKTMLENAGTALDVKYAG